MNRPLFKPGQVLFVDLTAYRVLGVYLGGEKYQNLIGIEPIGDPFTRIAGIRTSEVCVPETILLALIKEEGAELFESAIPMQRKLETAKKGLLKLQKGIGVESNKDMSQTVHDTLCMIENID
jgi:hypothetical protein